MDKNKTGRQTATQKLLVERSLLVMRTALLVFEKCPDEIVSALAVGRLDDLKKLQAEKNPYTTRHVSLWNTASVAYHTLVVIAEKSPDEFIKAIAQLHIDLAEMFLSEYVNRKDREPVDLVARLRQSI